VVLGLCWELGSVAHLWSPEILPAPSTLLPALRTLADVRAYMLDLPEDMVGRQAWQQAAKLLLAAAENPKTAAAGMPSAATFSWNDMPI